MLRPAARAFLLRPAYCTTVPVHHGAFDLTLMTITSSFALIVCTIFFYHYNSRIYNAHQRVRERCLDHSPAEAICGHVTGRNLSTKQLQYDSKGVNISARGNSVTSSLYLAVNYRWLGTLNY